MVFKRVLTGIATEEEARKFWGICLAIGFGSMATLRYESDANLILKLAGLGLSLASFLMKPVPRAVEIALATVIGIVTVGFVFGGIYFFSGAGLWVIPYFGFVVIAFSAFPIISRVIKSSATASGKETTDPEPYDFVPAVATRFAVKPDSVLYTAFGGATAIGLSLLELPWFELDNFDWNNTMSITFHNLRDVYNYVGADGDLRFLYLEWGYIASYVAAIFAVVTALRLRDGKSMISIALLNALIGVTSLVGLWQGVIATGLTKLDEDGKVQFGVWLGVIGHIALIVSFALMRQSMINRPSAPPPPH
jgi:hypothetical protein